MTTGPGALQLTGLLRRYWPSSGASFSYDHMGPSQITTLELLAMATMGYVGRSLWAKYRLKARPNMDISGTYVVLVEHTPLFLHPH